MMNKKCIKRMKGWLSCLLSIQDDGVWAELLSWECSLIKEFRMTTESRLFSVKTSKV